MKRQKNFKPVFFIDDNYSGDILQDKTGRLKRENNCTYFYLNGNNRMEIISTEDAKFLLLEGRITHLAVSSSTKKQVKNVKNQFQISEDKILTINSK